jgi:putative Mg2+ transporter-C (MgtC) family protein
MRDAWVHGTDNMADMDLLSHFAPGTYLPLGEVMVRLLVAALLGAIIGIEREWRAHSAGLRTHMVTSIAAALYTILAIEIIHSDVMRGETTQADPVRVLEAVTAGVAFLAAGAIIQARGRVRNLTTGAGMWLAGALGVTAGFGYIAIGLGAALLGFLVIAVLRILEPKAEKNPD